VKTKNGVIETNTKFLQMYTTAYAIKSESERRRRGGGG
jgi:hypothetical protein